MVEMISAEDLAEVLGSTLEEAKVFLGPRKASPLVVNMLRIMLRGACKAQVLKRVAGGSPTQVAAALQSLQKKGVIASLGWGIWGIKDAEKAQTLIATNPDAK